MIPNSRIDLYSIPELDQEYKNTFDFTNGTSQTNYFLSKLGISLYGGDTANVGFINYMYVRDNKIKIEANIDALLGYNYLSFCNNTSGRTYYAFITSKEYISDKVTQINYEIDVMQTYMFDYTLMDCLVDRCHVNRWNGGLPTNEIVSENLPIGDAMEIGRDNIYDLSTNFIISSSSPLGDMNYSSDTGIISGGGTKVPDTNDDGNNGIAGKAPSANLVYFIKAKEGFGPYKYTDPVGVTTQGYGFTGDEIVEHADGQINEAEATQHLYTILLNYYSSVYNTLTPEAKSRITQNQMDALCSFAYNLGVPTWKSDNCNLRKLVLDPNSTKEQITNKFLEYDKGTIGGALISLPGLTIRRKEEADIYNGNTSNIQGYGKEPEISIINTDGSIRGRMTQDDNKGGVWGATPIFTTETNNTLKASAVSSNLLKTNNLETEMLSLSSLDEFNTGFEESPYVSSTSATSDEIIQEVGNGRADQLGSLMNNLPYGLYFYYMNHNTYNMTINQSTDPMVLDNTKMLSCPAIKAITFAPYLDTTDLNMYPVLYDSKRFGSVDKSLPEVGTNNALALRIVGFKDGSERYVKHLGSTSKYKIENRNTPYRSWKHESKLYQFPYNYAILTDYLTQPIPLTYHLIDGNSIDVSVIMSISDKGTYSLFVDGYKGDHTGNMEGSILNTSLDMPVSSSAYANFMATSKSQYMASNATAFANMAKGSLSFNIGSTLSGILDTGSKLLENRAKLEDVFTTPNSMLTMGGDVSFSISNSNKKVQVVRYRVREEYLQVLGDYFAMYGYKQDKLMKPNLRSRWFYNYIKCHTTNIKGYGLNKEDLDKIAKIYQNGTTIWHIDRNSSIDTVIPLDYSKDNVEV